MIIEYGGRNCWAFKEWMSINFEINGNVPSEYAFSDVRVVPALCFEGANASGKSCALRVLSFIMDFCKNSFSLQADQHILVDTFFNNDEPADFFITFYLPQDVSTRYTYEVSLTKKRVISEQLKSIVNDTERILIKRDANIIVENNFSHNINQIIIKENSSFISTFIQYGVPEISKFVPFFSNFISNVTYNSTLDAQLVDYVASFYYNNQDLHRRVVEQLKMFDVGIDDVIINHGIDMYGNEQYLSKFIHKANAKDPSLSYFNQSNGTKLLYNQLKDFFIILSNGGVLVYDELGGHLHPRIVPFLYNMFLDEDNNPNHAQLIFTSHYSEVLDDMKKYRTYLFNKEEGESYCYRIDELPNNIMLRNDRSLESTYKTGVLGGVPNV